MKKSDAKQFKVVGKNITKKDSMAMATGQPLFTADILPQNMLYAGMLWSPFAHARIEDIQVKEARAVEGVQAVLTYLDVPRVAHTTAGQGFPEPSPYDTFMLDNKVRFVGDRVAAVAAESLEAVQEALKSIKVKYEQLPGVFDPEKALKEGAPVIHDEPEAKVIIPIEYKPERNLAAHVSMEIGDVEGTLKKSDYTLDYTYNTQYAQHTPIEPHVVLTYKDEYGRLVIRTSTQVPFHVRRIVAQRLEIPTGQIRVIKPRIGGGFGAKQEVLLEDICAALTLKTGRPVLFEYNRREEFVSSRTRHPMKVRIKTGFSKKGKLDALSMEVLSNTGAYGSHALTVPCNCGSKCLPLYKTNNVAFDAKGVYTNLPVGGAYRGYGATQAAFAMEVHFDEMAHILGKDPLEFRRPLFIQSGESSPVFQALGEGKEGVEQTIGSCGILQCIEKGAEAIGWKNRDRCIGNGDLRQGMGVACLMQGSSIPEIDMGAASLKMNEDGSFNLLVGATDLGTGSDTILAQIAAEELGISADRVIVYSSDTDMTPFDVGAYASSTTYLSGSAVQKAARKVKEQIFQVAAKMLKVPADKMEINNNLLKTSDGQEVDLSKVAIHSLYLSDQFQIGTIASHITHKSPPPFSAHFAEVEVDIRTGKVIVLKYVAAVDCGTAINPKLAEGQTEGGVLNGISYALTEEYLFNRHGRMLNSDLGNYKIFSTADLPRIETILVPTYEDTGPFGAKSVSEICINGPLPAISNAIFNAVGVRLRTAPFTPERVLQAIREKK